jgi:acetyl esterase
VRAANYAVLPEDADEFAGLEAALSGELAVVGVLPDVAARQQITATPLNASLEQLKGLPDALVIVDENDVLRDEGEAYARKLSEAGVRVTSVRYNGTVHDFVLLNALTDTPAVRGALQQANHALRAALHG